MRVVLTAPATSPTLSFRSKICHCCFLDSCLITDIIHVQISLTSSTKHFVRHCNSLHLKSRAAQFSTRIKASTAENFGDPKGVFKYVKVLADRLWENSPPQVKEFPWREATSIATERLLILGDTAFRYSFIALLVISFASDVITAVSGNRELLIPFGLFIGIALADILKESAQVFFESEIKDENYATPLWAAGSFFVLLKLITLCFSVKGKLLLSIVGSGGLMQILWLLKETQQKE